MSTALATTSSLVEVRMMMGVRLVSARVRRRLWADMPPPAGNMKSRMMSAGLTCRTMVMAWMPSWAMADS